MKDDVIHKLISTFGTLIFVFAIVVIDRILFNYHLTIGEGQIIALILYFTLANYLKD